MTWFPARRSLPFSWHGRSQTVTATYSSARRDNAKTVPSGALKSLKHLSDGRSELILAGDSGKTLTKGGFIAIGVTKSTPAGLLGRITKISQERGHRLIVDTVPATLQQAIPEGSFDVDLPSLTERSAESPHSAQSGSGAGPLRPFLEHLKCRDSAGAIVQGDVHANVGTKLSSNWGSLSPTGVTFTGTLTEFADATAEADAGASCSLADTDIAPKIPLGTIPVEVDGLLIVISPELQFSVSASASTNAKLSTKVTQSFTAEAGLQYSNGHLVPIHKVTNGFNWDPPTVTASGDMSVTIKAELTAGIDGTGQGPDANVTGTLDLNADTSANPWWKLTGDIEANVGLNIDKLGIHLPEYNVYTTKPLIDIAHACGSVSSGLCVAGGSASGGVHEAPHALQNVQVYKGPDTLTITWDPPPGANVEGYELDRDNQTVTYPPTLLSADTNSYTVTGAGGDIETITIKAYNAWGQSPPSLIGPIDIVDLVPDGPQRSVTFSGPSQPVRLAFDPRSLGFTFTGFSNNLLSPSEAEIVRPDGTLFREFNIGLLVANDAGYTGPLEPQGNGVWWLVIVPSPDDTTPGTVSEEGVPDDSFPLVEGRLSTSSANSCAIVGSGAVKCWGANADGQLGDGSTDDNASDLPVAVNGLSTATAISSSYDHSCALLADSTIACWGADYWGQLGDGVTSTNDCECNDTPTAVTSLGGTLTGAVAVSTNNSGACALLSDTTVDCWGWNGDGNLGDGSNSTSGCACVDLPVRVSGLIGAVSISGHCALLQDGSVDCWGSNGDGNLGDGTHDDSNIPVQVSGLTDATAISSGDGHVCALILDGTVDCWGYDEEGQLGNGAAIHDVDVPSKVDGLTDVTAISAGALSTCAIQSFGNVQCWGYDPDGALGVQGGTYGYACECTYVATPSAVSGLTGVTAISAGDVNVCALVLSGAVECWGDNEDGELGDGTTTDSDTPIPVVGISTTPPAATLSEAARTRDEPG